MEVINKLLSSQKFLTGIVAIIMAISNDIFGKPVDQNTILACLGVIGVLIHSQGLTDFGKAKAQIDAQSPPTPTPTPPSATVVPVYLLNK